MWHKINTPAEKAAFDKIRDGGNRREEAFVTFQMNNKHYFKLMIVDLDIHIYDAFIWEISSGSVIPISAMTHIDIWMVLPREQYLI
jgi:hypothetical protein